MFEPRPVRRDPRILLLDTTNIPTPYAALDAWEVRGLGELPRHSPSRALERLLLVVRPSHLIVVHEGAPRAPHGLRVGLRTATRRGINVLLFGPEQFPCRRARPSFAALMRTYPELHHIAASHDLRSQLHVLRLALAVLLHHPLPPRHYAPRQSSRTAPAVGVTRT